VRLSLTDGSAETDTTLTSVEPGKATETLVAKVYNQNDQLVPNVEVKLEVEVVKETGGHKHHDDNRPRPKGTLSGGTPTSPDVIAGNTGTDGFVFTFTAPAPAGDHTITASCTDRTCTQEGPDTVWAGVKGLKDILPGPYRLIGSDGKVVGWTPTHHDNHYLTVNAMSKLRDLGYWYSTVSFPLRPKLYINDASLERGGIFDINNNWKSPHFEHCRGAVVDIRANGVDGALNISSGDDPMIDDIKEMAKRFGIDAKWDVPVDKDGKIYWNLRHFHVRLLGQEGLACPS